MWLRSEIGTGQIAPGRQEHRPSAIPRAGLDGSLQGAGVFMQPVAGSAEVAHIADGVSSRPQR